MTDVEVYSIRTSTGPNGKNSGIPSKFMIQVRGGEDHSTRSVEVKFSSSSLNTNDVFVLCVDKRTYVWCGKGSTGSFSSIDKIK